MHHYVVQTAWTVFKWIAVLLPPPPPHRQRYISVGRVSPYVVLHTEYDMRFAIKTTTLNLIVFSSQKERERETS